MKVRWRRVEEFEKKLLKTICGLKRNIEGKYAIRNNKL